MKALVLFVLAAAASVPALAQTAPQRLETAHCNACHNNGVGPTYAQIAARYAGQPGAAATLVASVRNGVSGKWTQPIAMPPQNLPEGEAKALVDYILSLKK